MGYVYILQSLKNGKYYIGSTNEIERRLYWHQNGKVKSTKGMLPVKLIFSQKFDTLTQARSIENKLKSLKNKSILNKIVIEGKIRMRE